MQQLTSQSHFTRHQKQKPLPPSRGSSTAGCITNQIETVYNGRNGNSQVVIFDRAMTKKGHEDFQQGGDGARTHPVGFIEALEDFVEDAGSSSSSS